MSHSKADQWCDAMENANRDRKTIAALVAALEDVLPYAKASIGLPRECWPADSVILQAEAAIKLAKGPQQ